MPKNRPATYPKTYATVTGIVLLMQRAGQPVRRMTPDEVRDRAPGNGKRRLYCVGGEYTLALDAGGELKLESKDWMHGAGGRHRRKQMKVGARVKMYKHPKDTRPWRYKFLGE